MPVVMPSFAASYYGFHHTVDSALETLAAAGVPPGRVTIRMAGLGAPDRWVVRQDPAPGTELHGGATVQLWIAGLGFFEHLPVGMWQRGTEAEPGADDLTGTFDDPIQKAVHWVRQGARLFHIRPQEHAACARWLRLFGFVPELWPAGNWYHLALLAGRLQQLGGSREGVRLALQLLLGLPLLDLSTRPSHRKIPNELLSRFGARSSRLGVDLVAGDRLEEWAGWLIRIGPVSLETYWEYHQGGRARLEQALRLVIPADAGRRIDWLALEPRRAPRLGVAGQNANLGIDTHLGDPARSEAAAA